MSFAINISNVSKRYTIGTAQSATIGDVIRNLISKKGTADLYWALKDIDLEIRHGEALAVIGKNGAGKSTLLKILSRITYPTSGKIEINGSLSSLLEVGTGFHPELTGRENIFLNGTILGMSRSEIRKKLDEIIAFSDIERFIDTPVKRYSSGMYVRLAFSVAAHLEPDILIVDEVLAVGDASFQKKCLGKMGEVAGEGRTVIFVSHNMNAVKNLCTSAVFLDKGICSPKLEVGEAIRRYNLSGGSEHNLKFPLKKDYLTIHEFSVKQNGTSPTEFSGDDTIDLCIDFELNENQDDFRIGCFIKDELGDTICRSLLTDWTEGLTNIKSGRYQITTKIDAGTLTSGMYHFQIHSSIYGYKDIGMEDLISTPVKLNNPSNFNPSYAGERRFGHIIPNNRWTFN